MQTGVADVVAVAKATAPPRLSQRHIQRQHDAKARGKENRADVGGIVSFLDAKGKTGLLDDINKVYEREKERRGL